MIKITQVGFQGDNVSATVEFDLQGQNHSFDVVTPMLSVLGMTVDQIKDWVRTRVANRRGQILQSQVNALLGPLVDIDIEET